jgi:toxin ParE1/3/4
MRVVRILAAVANEAAEAAAWYESERYGLGEEFQRAIDAALDLLEEDIVPLTPAVGAAARKLGAKRLTLRRFPYDVVVRESGDEIIVIAFAHHAR